MDETGRIILRAAIEEAEEALAFLAREASEVFSSILTDIDKLGATSDGKQQPLTGEEKIAAQEALDQLVAYMGRAAAANTALFSHVIRVLRGRNRFGRSLFGEGWRVWRKPLATAQERGLSGQPLAGGSREPMQ